MIISRFFELFLGVLGLVSFTQGLECWGENDNFILDPFRTSSSCRSSTATNAFSSATCDDLNAGGRFITNQDNCTANANAQSCALLAVVVPGFPGVLYGGGCPLASYTGTMNITACVPVSAVSSYPVTTTMAPSTTTGPTTMSGSTTTSGTTTTGVSTITGTSTTTPVPNTTTTGPTTAGPTTTTAPMTTTGPAEIYEVCAKISVDASFLNCSSVMYGKAITSDLVNRNANTSTEVMLGTVDASVFVQHCCTTSHCNSPSSAGLVPLQYRCSRGSGETNAMDSYNTDYCDSCWAFGELLPNGTYIYVQRGCKNELGTANSTYIASLTCGSVDTPTCIQFGARTECYICCLADNCNAAYTSANFIFSHALSLKASAVFTFFVALLLSIYL